MRQGIALQWAEQRKRAKYGDVLESGLCELLTLACETGGWWNNTATSTQTMQIIWSEDSGDVEKMISMLCIGKIRWGWWGGASLTCGLIQHLTNFSEMSRIC